MREPLLKLQFNNFKDIYKAMLIFEHLPDEFEVRVTTDISDVATGACRKVIYRVEVFFDGQ